MAKSESDKTTVVHFEPKRESWLDKRTSMHVDFTNGTISLAIHGMPEVEYNKLLKKIGKKHIADFESKGKLQYRLVKMLAEVTVWCEDKD